MSPQVEAFKKLLGSLKENPSRNQSLKGGRVYVVPPKDTYEDMQAACEGTRFVFVNVPFMWEAKALYLGWDTGNGQRYDMAVQALAGLKEMGIDAYLT